MRRGLTPAFHTLHYSPRFGGQVGLRRVLEASSAAGFTSIGLDLASVDGFLDGGETLDDLASMIRELELQVTDVVALSVASDHPPTDLAQRLSDVATAVGTTVCVAAAAAGPSLDEIVADLSSGADILSASGIRLAIEFGGYFGLRTLDHAVAACEQLGWDRAGLALDSYQWFRSACPIAAIEQLEAGQVALVQLADASGPSPVGQDLIGEAQHRRQLPGTGDLPLQDFLDAICRVGYRGAVTAEVLSEEVRRAAPEPMTDLIFRSMTLLIDGKTPTV